MKLGFWTLGMPPWSNSEVAQKAVETGCDGVDLRCTRPAEDGSPADGGNLSIESGPDEVKSTIDAFAEAGIEVSSLLCYSPKGHSGALLAWPELESDLATHAQLAEQLGAPRLRVTVGHPPEGGSFDEHLNQLWRSVQAALVDTPSVGAVFENHPGTANAFQLLSKAEEFGDERIGVEFSPDHTHVMQEPTIDLVRRFAPFIHQVCIADRRPVAEDLAKFDGRYYTVRYESCMIGDGAVPLAGVIEALAEEGYDGYLSLKWEKSERFGHHLDTGDVALQRFVEYVRPLM